MTVFIIIAAVFAYQIYVPANAGAWSRPGDSGYIAIKRSHVSGAAAIAVPQQIGATASGLETQTSANSQTREIYGEYSVSPHILIVAKALSQHTQLAADTRRLRYHEIGLQTPFELVAYGLLPPGTVSALRLAFPHLRFNHDTSAAVQIFRHETSTRNTGGDGHETTHANGGGLTVLFGDRLGVGNFHLEQNLALTQFNSFSSGPWKADYDMHIGYRNQLTIGWMRETYQDQSLPYESHSQYITVSFYPPDQQFGVRLLRGYNKTSQSMGNQRSFRVELGWSFP